MDRESDAAAAQLWRLAEAGMLRRLFRERKGRDARSLQELGRWVKQHRPDPTASPTPEDFREVELKNLDLVLLAFRGRLCLVDGEHAPGSQLEKECPLRAAR